MGHPVEPTRRLSGNSAVPPTRRVGGQRQPGHGHGDLRDVRPPRELADRFDFGAEALYVGGEAEIWPVRDGEGNERILKVYWPGIEPDPEVSARRESLDSAHLIRLIDWGRTGGRSYELMEYVPGGSLAELLHDHPNGLSTRTIRAIVEQLTEALVELHRHDIVHKDVKPPNVLVRSLERPEIVLTDFGIAAHIDQTVIFRTGSRGSGTTAYAAPEVFANAISATCDWWSLGISVAELASGSHPFDGMTEQTAILQIVQSTVPIPENIDPEVRHLCEGLIVGDRALRWGAGQVKRWLAGDPPPAPSNRAPPHPDRKPFSFHGIEHTERAPLAVALASSWGEAAHRFFDPMAGSWFELREWLRQFDDPGHQASSEELAARLERGGLPHDVNLLLLLRWMDPGLPASYRGYRMAFRDVPRLVREAARGDAFSAQIIDELWDHRLLAELDAAPGGRGLAGVDSRWRDLDRSWQRITAELSEDHPQVGPALAGWRGSRLHGWLLWLASVAGAEATVRNWIDAAQRAIRRDLRHVRGRLDWFDAVVASATNPVAQLAAYAVSGHARAEAERIRIRHAAEQAAHAVRVGQWNRRERWRDLDRPVGIGWAAAAMGIFAIGWMVLLLLSDAVPIAAPAAVTRAWTFMAIALTLQTGAELWLAAIIGAPYHPDYSLLMGIGRVAGATGRRFRHQGTAGLVVVTGTVGALLAVTVFVPFLLPLILVPAHVGWVHVRYRRWRDDHERRRQRALRPPSAPLATASATQAAAPRDIT